MQTVNLPKQRQGVGVDLVTPPMQGWAARWVAACLSRASSIPR